MAGKIIADTIETGAGADISTSYVVNGSAKAWINFNGTGTIASRDSFSVSSISDNGTGSTTLTFSNAFNSADYVLNYTTGYGASVNFTTTAPTTTTALIQSYRTDTGASQDRTYNLVALHGDLA
jgi:hypothetical protein